MIVHDRYHADLPSRSSQVFWILVLLASGIAAGVLFQHTDRLAGRQDGDGVLTALISLQDLTWYFWGQDRFLNTIPAAASLFSDADTNLRVQLFLRTITTWLSPVAMLMFVSTSARFLTIATVLTNALLIACLSQYGQFNLYVQHNPFGTSLVLFAVAGLVFAGRPGALSAFVALLLCLIGYATNSAMLLFSLPLLGLLFLSRPGERRHFFVFGAINVLAILLAMAHSRLVGEGATQYGVAPSLSAMAAAAAAVWREMNGTALLIASIATACAAPFAPPRLRGHALLLVLVAMLGFVVLSSTVWVHMNAYNIRYFLTAIIAVAAAMAALLTYPLARAIRLDWPWMVAIAAAMVACITPGLGGIGATRDEIHTPDRRVQTKAIASRAVTDHSRFVVGDFWDVWPVVYETMRLRTPEENARDPVFGIAPRAATTGPLVVNTVVGSGEQNALCMLPTAEACAGKVREELRLPPDVRVETIAAEAVQVGDKALLRWRFRMERGG